MSLSKEQIIALLSLPNMGKVRVLHFVNALKHQIADEELVDSLNEYGYTKRKAERYTQRDVDAALGYARSIVEQSEEYGIGIVSCFDRDYPSVLKQYKGMRGGLQALQEPQSEREEKAAYETSALREWRGSQEVSAQRELRGLQEPSSLLDVKSPLIVYYRGALSLLDNDLVTVIGSREELGVLQRSSSYIAREFVKRGFAIVSGLATGCDSAAHRGALQANGQTIGVLPGGLVDKVIYPKENLGLSHDILAQGGLLISEYAPNTRPTRYSFVQRDTLQAAVSQSTILIASKVDGGSMYACKECYRIGKPLYALEYRREIAPPAELIAGNACMMQEYGAQSINAFSRSKEDMKKRLDDIAAFIRHTKSEAED